jgi:hypothetical protein
MDRREPNMLPSDTRGPMVALSYLFILTLDFQILMPDPHLQASGPPAMAMSSYQYPANWRYSTTVPH